MYEQKTLTIILDIQSKQTLQNFVSQLRTSDDDIIRVVCIGNNDSLDNNTVSIKKPYSDKVNHVYNQVIHDIDTESGLQLAIMRK